MFVFPSVLFLVSFLHDKISYSIKQCIWRKTVLCCQLEKVRGWGVDESLPPGGKWKIPENQSITYHPQTFTFCPQRSCIRKINSLDATSLLGFKGIAWDNHSQRLVSFPLALHCPGVLSCPDFIAESTRTGPPSCRYTDSTVCSRDEQPEKQNNTFHISFTLSQTNQTAYSLFQTRALHRSVEVNPPPLVHSSGDPASSLKFFWD